jgi:hypothetical protein
LVLINKINSVIDREESNQYGIMTLAITAGSCLAGIAAMFILQNDAATWQLGTVAATAMGSNAMAIGQAPFKTFAWSFIISAIVSAIFIAINVF